ncbi:hypothetical protein CVT24_009673 [Panaeolus cyanescens]|uniref:Uncharacterized protein n=1 Tax=Panaeolus cyanescens TaxID=181874 RepID=A0A409Y9M3_9AGAR|nr:hypothetical protein CVT24_009673 [Panaeolus cyanescens]
MDSFLQLVKKFELDVQSMSICHDEDVRLHIDSKVEELRHTIILFHQLRNRRTTISKLPNELLGLIFYYIRDSISSDCGARLSWIPCVSHVCTLWREVALAMPHLWASISVTSVGRRWLPEMVRRSCSANLSISANYDGYNFVPNMQTVLHEDVLHHLVNLQLTNVDASCLRAVFPPSEADTYQPNEDKSRFKFPRRFSSLRKLAISARARPSDPVIICDTSLDAPYLQQLELTCCSVQWDAKFFGRLTHLDITNPTFFASASSSTLLDALTAASETLTSLKLVRSLCAIVPSNSLFLGHSDVLNPVSIHLPLLQKLCVSESITNIGPIISFITTISTPPNTQIELSISSAEGERGRQHLTHWRDGFSHILARIPEFLSRSGWTASPSDWIRRGSPVAHWASTSMGTNKIADINALSLSHSTNWQRSRFELGLDSSINPASRHKWFGRCDDIPFNFKISFEWIKPREAICDAACDTSSSLAMQAFNVFDLTKIRRLRCQGIDMPTESWRRAFCHLERLEELYFSHLPGGQNNFFSGSLASGSMKPSQSVERVSRALYWDDEQEYAQFQFGSPTHIFHAMTRFYKPPRLLLLPALRRIVSQVEDSSDNWATFQEAVRRRVEMGLSPFEVIQA